MCGKENRGTAAREISYGVFQNLAVDRIQPGERLIENHEVRTMLHRGDKLDLLLHSLGKLVDLPAAPLRQPDLVQPLQGFETSRRSGHALGLPQENEVIENLHLLI